MKSLTILVIWLIGLALAACESLPKTAMTDNELEALISGQTVYATSSRGKPYTMYFSPDGKLANSGGETGVWEIKDGSLCNTYDSRGAAGCDKFFQTEDGKYTYRTPSGGQGSFNKLVEGNPEGL